MAAENLLVNIDIETKSAKRGVDDLNKSLSENTKQTKEIQKELKRLEKEYKSIATAVKKLPAKDVDKLNKEVTRAEKATRKLSDQFDKTDTKMRKVKERTIETTDAFALLGASILAFKNLEPLRLFAGRVVQASQAVMFFQSNLVPFVKDTIGGLKTGFVTGKKAVQEFAAVYPALTGAILEQKQAFQGYHLVRVKHLALNAKIATAFQTLNTSASAFHRTLTETFVAEEGFIKRTTEGYTRVTKVFRSLGDGVRKTTEVVGAFHKSWFGTFGSSSAGAAQINKWQKLMLELGYAAEVVGIKLKSAFAAMSSVSARALASASPLVTRFTEAGAAGKVFFSKMISGVGDLTDVFAKGQKYAGAFFTSMASAFSRALPTITEAGAIFKVFVSTVQTKLAGAMQVAAKSVEGFSFSVFKAAVSSHGLTKNFFTLLEGMQGAGLAFIGIGSLLKSTDNAILDLIGSTVQLIGLFSVSLASAATVVLGIFGSLTSAIGSKLIDAMNSWEKAFSKAEQVTKAFEFVVKGFGKTFKTEVIGSVEAWNATILDLTNTTTFSTFEIQKAIKVLIAEGSQLGITFEQNAMLLKRATDIAAISGSNLEDVTLAIARGLAGNSSSLQSLGIFVDNASLQHSKLAEKQGLVVESLDKNAKAQLVMNVLMQQTIPQIGAAAAQLDTIAGANKQYEATVDSLTVKLGSQSVLFAKATQVQTAFLKVLDAMPKPVFDIIGIFIDVAGVLLKVVGTFITMAVTLYTLISVYKAASTAVAYFTFLQIALAIPINTLRVGVGLQAVAVTSLGAAFKAVAQTAIPAVMMGMASLKAVIVATSARVYAFTVALLFTRAGWAAIIQGAVASTVAVARFTVALLTNPLFVSAAVITAGIYGVVKAFEQLKEEVTFLMPVLAAVSSETVNTTNNLKAQASVLSGMGKLFMNVMRMITIGWLKIIKLIQLAIVGYQMLWQKTKGFFTDTSKSMAELDAEGMKHIDSLGELEDAYQRTFDPMRMSAFKLKVTEVSAALSGVAQAGRGFSDSLKLSSDMSDRLNIEVLGDEVDRAKLKFEEATRALNTLRNIGVFKVGTEIIVPTTENLKKFSEGTLLGPEGQKVTEQPVAAKEQDILKALIEAEAARLDLIKLRKAATEDASKALQEQHIRTLEATGKEVEAIRARGGIELKALQEKLEAQNKISKLSRSELAVFKNLEKAIGDSTAGEIAKLQVRKDAELLESNKKRLDVINELEKTYRTLREEILRGSGDEVGAEKIKLQIQLEQIDALELNLQNQEKLLDATGNLKKEYADTLKSARELANIKFGEFVEANTFTSKLIKAVEEIPAENFGARLAKGMITGGLKAAQLIDDAISASIPALNSMGKSLGDIFEGVDFSKLKSMENPFADMKNPFAGMDVKNMKNPFSGMDFKKIGISIGTFAANALVTGASMIGKLFDPDEINKMADFFGEFLQKLPENLINAFQKLSSILISFIEKFPSLVSKLMEALPGLIAGIIEKIPMIIDALVEGFGTFIDKLPSIISMLFDAIPGIITKLMDALPGILMKILNAIGTIVAQFIKAFPAMVIAFVEGIPDIVLALVEGIISAAGDIVTALTDFFLAGGLERIIVAILKAIPRIVVALVTGIANGLKRALGKILGGLPAPSALEKLPAKFSKGIKDLAKKAALESSKLFKVLDLEDAAAGLAGKATTMPDIAGEMIKVGKRVQGILEIAFRGLINAFKWLDEKVLQPFIRLLTKAWQWIWDTIIKPIGEFLTTAWQRLLDLFASLKEIVQQAWQVVLDLFASLKEIVQQAWQVVLDIFNGLKGIVSEAFKVVTDLFDGLKDIVSEAFSGITEAFKTVGSTIWEGLKTALGGAGAVFAGLGDSIWNALSSGLSGLGKIFTDAVSGIGGAIGNALKALDPSNLFAKMFQLPPQPEPGTVEKALGINIPFLTFAEGGTVPGNALVKGDSPLNDKILAMLSPGEAVIPRSVMQDPLLSKVVESLISNRADLPKFAFGIGSITKAASSLGGDIAAAAGVGGTTAKILEGDVQGVIEDIASVDFNLLWDTVKEKVFGDMLWKMLGANKFHMGGPVGYAMGGEVPAMLQSGEFVINRQAVQSLGLGTLNRLNQGGSQSNQEFNFDIKMDVRADNLPDETFIRQKMIPVMKRELKAASIRGEFLISNKGIRET